MIKLILILLLPIINYGQSIYNGGGGSGYMVDCVGDVNDHLYPWWTSGIGVPLPVELINFKVEIKNDMVAIYWQTVSEVENDFFTIESSIDGVDWRFVEQVNGVGNSTELVSYSGLDRFPNQGVNYYRLKQTDYDGHFQYSELRTVNFISILDFTIHPNPSKGLVSINFGDFKSALVKVRNIQGQLVHIDEVKDSSSYTFLLQEKAGIYFVEINTDNLTKVIKLIKE